MGGNLFVGENDDIQIKGATDGTLIGNVDDKLKVTAGVELNDGPNLDAFGRLRTSEPQTIFDCTFFYDKQPLLFAESTASGGTVTHDANKKAVVLTATTTTNSSATFQSKRHIKYHPGKSNQIFISGNFKGGATSVIKRVGQFDGSNGVYFELNESTPYVVMRSSISGSVVNTAVTQASWNIDPLDGTGPSGYTVDFTKQQIFVIDYQWLGSGRVRFGLDIAGTIVYCHEFLNANSLTTLWSQTGDNPLAMTITNTGSTTSTMEITCCVVVSEGGWFPDGFIRTINNGTTVRNFGLLGSVLVPVLSIRKKSAYIKSTVQIVDVGGFANSSDDFLLTLVLNGTLTGASWTDVNGSCQRDVAATAISGGEELISYYIRGGTGATSVSLKSLFTDTLNVYLGSDVAGTSDIISIAVINLTSTASFLGFLNYKEIL